MRRPQVRFFTATAVLLAVAAGIVAIAWQASEPFEQKDHSVLAAPEVERATVTLRSTPAGAQVYIDGRATGLATPASIQLGRTTERRRVRFELDGYRPFEEQLVVEGPAAVLDATLQGSAAAVADQDRGDEPGTSMMPPSLPASQRAAAPSVQRRARSTGVLSLRSAGIWYDVYAGSRKLGTTPLSEVSMPAGRYRLKLVNRKADTTRFVDVVIERGKHTRETVSP